MKTAAAAATALLLTSCSTAHPTFGHWVGSVTPSTPGPTCEKSRAILDVANDGKVSFAPNEGTWILTGTITKDGVIVATRSQPGADKKLFVTRLDATAISTAINGTYATPRCNYSVTLSPAPRG